MKDERPNLIWSSIFNCMSDRAKKITELANVAAPTGVDLLIVHDASANATLALPVGNLLANNDCDVRVRDGRTLTANTVIVRKNVTPANGTVLTDVSAGTIWADSNYIYVATANGVVKRVALSSF